MGSSLSTVATSFEDVEGCFLVVADDATIQKAAAKDPSVTLLQVGDYTAAQATLQSGSIILMAPSDALVSESGRTLLAQRMSSLSSTASTTTTEQDVNSSAEEAAMVEIDDDVVDVGEMDLVVSPEPVEERRSPVSKLFPSLQVQLLEREGRFRSDFAFNSTTATEFETDIFKGKILVLVRPENPSDDPYWNERIFSKRQRRLIVQVQGKFKHEPTGIVYAGAEVTKQMKLGLVTRGLSSVLLRLIEGFNPKVHYSYGDSEGREKPHIVVPAYQFFEKIIVTPPGETPPPIDEVFEETRESIAKRKKAKTDDGQWNTSDTYSLSFYTMYIDLPTWQVVGVPITSDISLKVFWGDSLLRLCMYEKLGSEKKHLQESNRYAFVVQIKYLGPKRLRDQDETESGDDTGDILRWSEKRQSIVQEDVPVEDTTLNRSESQLFPLSENDDESSHDEHYFDANQKEEEVIEYKHYRTSFITTSTSTLLLSRIDRVCPFWIDLFVEKTGYTRVFGIRTGSELQFRRAKECEELVRDSTAEAVIDEHFSPRMSSQERLRRIIGYTLSRENDTLYDTAQLRSFLDKNDTIGESFLRDGKRPKSERERLPVQLSSFVARALCDRHWIEEWATVTSRGITFYHAEKRKRTYHLYLSSILTISPLTENEGPGIADCSCLSIATVGRTLYLMFRSESRRDEFMSSLRNLKATWSDDSSQNSSLSRLLDVENPADEYIHHGTKWNHKHRRLLNNSVYSFVPSNTELNPQRLVESALQLAVKATYDTTDDLDLRRSFLTSAALLKQAHVSALDEDGKLAFFLNLYHVMILHAYLVLGPPDSTFKWISYFNNISYEVSDDIFSLAELEHCILRAEMCYPSQFISRFVLPKSQYHIALTKAHFQINFALNCGSLSNPSEIYIYNPIELETQLNDASRLFLRNSTMVRRGSDLILSLPRVCQWFLEDFGSTVDMLTKVAPFLPDEIQHALRPFWSRGGFDMNRIQVRYLPYNFDCRPFRLA